MKGRQENEEKLEKKTLELINNSYPFMRGYYNFLKEYSYLTRNHYVKHTLDFISFLDEYWLFEVDEIEKYKEVKPVMIRNYINGLKCEGAAKVTRYAAINSFFCYLVESGYIDSNPVKSVKAPKDKKEHEVTYLTEEEQKIVINNVINGVGNDVAKYRQKRYKNRDLAIVLIGMTLGLRVRTISEINISDVDLVNRKILVTEKGNKTRYIDFGDNLEKVLKAWLEDRDSLQEYGEIKTDALFISKNLTRLNVGGIRKLIAKYTYNIDKHISPHKLRSTCAMTSLKATGGNVYLVSKMLGHSNVNTTMRYLTALEDEKKKVTDQLDGIFDDVV